MRYNEIVYSLVFSLCKKFELSILRSFLSEITSRKKFFKIEKFLKTNGLLASQMFLNSLKILYLVKRIFIFIFKTSYKQQQNKLMKTSTFFPTMTCSVFNLSSFFPKINILKPQNLGQLVWIEGFLDEIGPPLIKKLEKSDLRKKNFIKKINPAGSENDESFNEKNLKIRRYENISLINYQETKLIPLERLNSKKNLQQFGYVFIYFVDGLVNKFSAGSQISILGIVKRKNSYYADHLKMTFCAEFVIEALYIKTKKRKSLWRRLLIRNKISMIDFKSVFQDSKIRNFGYVIRNSLLLLKNLSISKFSKLLLSLVLIGGCSTKSNKNIPFKNFSHCIVIGGCYFEKKSFLEKIHWFWMDALKLSFNVPIKNCVAVEDWEQRDNKCRKLKYFLASITRSGVLLSENTGLIIRNRFTSIIDAIDIYVRSFFYSTTNKKNMVKCTVILGLFHVQKCNEQAHNKKTILKSKKLYSRTQIFKWTHYYSNFDAFLIIKNVKLKNKSKRLTTMIMRKNRDSLGENNFAHKNQKESRIWKSIITRAYFFYVKTFDCPDFSKNAEDFLSLFYASGICFCINKNNPILIFEKIIRISQAHARLLSRDAVQPQDCSLSIFILNKMFFLKKKIARYSNQYESLNETKFLNWSLKFQKFMKLFITKSFDDHYGLCGGNFNY